MGEGKLENRLWEIFNLGMKAGHHSGMRLVVDNARDNAAQIIKEVCALRSPEEVRSELKRAFNSYVSANDRDDSNYWQSYQDALQWMLRE